MKKLFKLIVASALMLSLVACGPGQAPQESGSSTQSNQEGTASSGTSTDETAPVKEIGGDLVVWYGIEEQGKAIIEAFNAHYPNVNVRLEVVGMEAPDKLALDGPSGIGGDVIFLNHDAINTLVDDGFLEPFPDDIKARLDDVILDNAIDMATKNGNLYGVPFTLENYGLLYNKDLVDGTPETFEELIEFAHSYNDPSIDKYAMRWLAFDFYHSYFIFDTFGFRLFGPNGDDWRNPGFDSPEFAAGLAFYQSLREIFDVDAADTNNNEFTFNAFARGEVPYIVAHSWLANQAAENGIRVGATKLPTINGIQPRNFIGSVIMGVSSYSKNFDAAFAFAEFMATKEAASIVYEITGVGPALKDISGIDGLAEDEVLLGLAEQAPYTFSAPAIPEFGLIWVPMMDTLTFVWDSTLTISEAQIKAMESYELLLQADGRSMYE
ncbi:MAG: extracellular solute-binding protein [Lachnospiraceae bacterium]|nr:extracellular solute-binding protein [Lachnospiraceae bacterium]